MCFLSGRVDRSSDALLFLMTGWDGIVAYRRRCASGFCNGRELGEELLAIVTRAEVKSRFCD